MTVEELEKKVWKQDNVRIIVRDRSTARVKEYCQARAACKSWSIAKFLKRRINPLVKDKEIVVFDGNGKMPNRKTLLKTIRQSYN
jgi:hypothetical protein